MGWGSAGAREGRPIPFAGSGGDDPLGELELYIVHDINDAADAKALADGLKTRLQARLASSAKGRLADVAVPKIQTREGIETLPAVGEIAPLALVLLVLPGRDFTAPERAVISTFLGQSGDELRLLPVACVKERFKPPEPLHEKVSADVDLRDDGRSLDRLTTWALIQLCLRTSEDQRSVFISYRVKDGAFAAGRLAECLSGRNYKVFLDEKRDDDDQKMLKWGLEAQKSLYQEIARHSLVLVIDTPFAPESVWVEKEINAALGLMLPVLPVVIYGEGESGENVARGGRFMALVAQQKEVTLGPEALTQEGAAQAIDQSFVAQLEAVMAEHLLRHLAVQRSMIRATRQQFRDAGFTFDRVPDSPLYEAWAKRKCGGSPWLRFRFLVGCSPYKSIVAESIKDIKMQIHEYHQQYPQYGILVQPPRADRFYVAIKDLLTEQDAHLLVLQPDEIGGFIKSLLVPEAAP